MPDNSYVQLAADGTGKKVRNLQLDVLQVDGTIATVQMQVIAIADSEGRPVSVEPERALLRDLRAEARLQTAVLLRILAACEPGEDMDRETLLAELEQEELLDGELQGVE